MSVPKFDRNVIKSSTEGLEVLSERNSADGKIKYIIARENNYAPNENLSLFRCITTTIGTGSSDGISSMTVETIVEKDLQNVSWMDIINYLYDMIQVN